MRCAFTYILPGNKWKELTDIRLVLQQFAF